MWVILLEPEDGIGDNGINARRLQMRGKIQGFVTRVAR